MSLRRRLLFRLSHPPDKLRQFFLRRGHSYAVCLMLLVYPAAYLVQGAAGMAHGILSQASLAASYLSLSYVSGASAELGSQEFWRDLALYAAQFVTARAPVWLYTAVMLFVWPFLSHRWERFFSNARKMRHVSDEPLAPNVIGVVLTAKVNNVRYHILVSMLCGGVFLLLLAGAFILQPRHY